MAVYESGRYMYADESGAFKGYAVDYLEEIARYAHWSCEYVAFPDWGSAQAAVEASQVDLLPLVYRTDEREERLTFSSLPLCELQTSLVVRADDSRYAYEDFAAFDGMRVAVIADSQDAASFEFYRAQHGFSVEPVPCKTTEEALGALSREEVDGVAISYPGSDAAYRTVAQFDPQPLYLVMPSGSVEMAERLDQAMGTLKLRDPDFATQLFERYFKVDAQQDPVFTRDEYAYLESAPVLRVAYDANRAPLSYTDPETGEFAGVAALLFQDIARVTGLRFQYVAAQSHGEAAQLVAQGSADILYAADRSRTTDESLVVTGTYLRNPMVMVVGSNPQGTRVALPSGYPLSQDMAPRAVQQAVYFDTPKACFDAVLSGEADIAYADAHVADYLLSESQYDGLTVSAVTSFSNDMGIGVAARLDARLESILDRCVQGTSEGTMTAWLSQSSLAVHPTSPVDFLRQYPVQIIAGMVALFALLSGTGIYLSRMKLRAARRIEELSFTDPLTGGWSFARFRSAVSDQLATAKDGEYALLYLDVKQFKSFNAAFGYEAGDTLLRELERIIGRTSRADEHYARNTADEFVTLMRWEGEEAFLERFDELDRLFNQLPVLTERSHRLVLHAGLCVVERRRGETRIDPQTVVVLMDCARYARDSIGETSRSTAAFYTDDMKERDIAERALVAQATDALARGEFTAYYQPKVELATNRIVGFEALARWESPERGVVPPDGFIPLFEKTGLVKELDMQLFALACARIREQLDAGQPAPLIACNFSRLHLADGAFPETLEGIVARYGVPKELLELELTENIVMEDLARAESMCRRLKDGGFRIAIDDFGSGYSSLGTLQNLPIDVLKLDRSFLMSSESGKRSHAILDGVVGIADKLGVEVVVEGVETREQAAMLMRLDTRIIAQGYLYSRPVPRGESERQWAGGTLEPEDGA